MAEYCEFVDWGIRHPVPIEIPREKKIEKRPIDTAACIQAIRALIPTRKDVAFTRSDDAFILRFLHARKCNIPDSFELLTNYFLYRQRNSHLFVNFSAEDGSIQQALRDGFPGVLPERDRRGRRVLVIFTDHWDHCSYTLETIYRSLLLTLERLIETPQNQLNGFIVIVDWSEFSFRQSSNLTPRILKLMIEGLQDCFPARFKGIHFINQPWYVEAALTVIKPFLKEKTKEKIFLHGNNLSTLHDYITKDILPAELGGEAPSYHPLTWAQELTDAAANEKLNKEAEPAVSVTGRAELVDSNKLAELNDDKETEASDNNKESELNGDTFTNNGVECNEVLLKAN